MSDNRIDSFIFDVDGTIWDSTGVVAEAWTKYLKEEQQIDRLITADQLKKLFGNTLPAISAMLFPERSEADQLVLIDGMCRSEHDAIAKYGATTYPGIGEALKALCEKYPLFVVSNCEGGYIELMLEKTGFGPYITGHLCPGDTGNAKAENIAQIAAQYHLSHPVYVGDTAGDQEACKKAGVPFMHAAYGFGTVTNPEYRIEKPLDLLKFL